MEIDLKDFKQFLLSCRTLCPDGVVYMTLCLNKDNKIKLISTQKIANEEVLFSPVEERDDHQAQDNDSYTPTKNYLRADGLNSLNYIG